MAVTSVGVIDHYQEDATGARKKVLADVVLSNSYTASGEEVTPAQLGLSKIDSLKVVHQPANGFVAQFDGTKLRLFRTGTAVSTALQELPGATNAAGTYRVEATGRAA
jgi:hypothetical protein